MNHTERATHENGAYDGDASKELLQRMRRVEIRCTNALRTMGIIPGGDSPDPMPARAIYRDGCVYATGPEVTLGEIMREAARNAGATGGDARVVLFNQVVGTVRVLGKTER